MQCVCSQLDIAAKNKLDKSCRFLVNRTRQEGRMISRFTVWEQCCTENQQHNRAAAGNRPKPKEIVKTNKTINRDCAFLFVYFWFGGRGLQCRDGRKQEKRRTKKYVLIEWICFFSLGYTRNTLRRTCRSIGRYYIYICMMYQWCNICIKKHHKPRPEPKSKPWSPSFAGWLR